MFLQSQKKKSNIKYKASEKSKKRSKSKTKSKPKPKQKKQEPIPPKEQVPPPPPIEEDEGPPMPSNIHPVITQPMMHQPEMPMEFYDPNQRSNQKPYDSSKDAKNDLRFNVRDTARFGIEIEESEGPDLFVNVDDANSPTETEITSQGYPNKTSDFVSMGKRNQYPVDVERRNERGQSPFDSDGIFGNFDLSKKRNNENTKHHGSYYKKNVGAGNNRKVTSEITTKNGSRMKKKNKMLVNIFENDNEGKFQHQGRFVFVFG
jgi:hypothetical protein